MRHLQIMSFDPLKKYNENLKEDLRKRTPSPTRRMCEDGLLLDIINKNSVFGLESQFDNDAISSLKAAFPG